MHTHRSTVCHCITLHSLRHTVHIYSFITISTLCEKSSFPSTLSLHSISLGPGLLHVLELQPACFTLLHIKLSSQYSNSHNIRTTHKTHKYQRNKITRSTQTLTICSPLKGHIRVSACFSPLATN